MSTSLSATIFDQFDGPPNMVSSLPNGVPAKLGTAYTCVKILLVAANVVFVIFGIVLLAVASYALTSDANDLAGVSLPAGIITIGAFMFLLALLGCLSSWRESRVGLIVYLVFLILIVLLLFSVSIAVYVQRDRVEEYLIDGWNYSPPDMKQSLMIDFKCCGLQTFPTNTTHDCPSPALVTIPPGQICLPLFEASLRSAYMTAGGCGIAFAILMGTVIGLVIMLLHGVVRRKRELDLIQRSHASVEGEIDDLSNDHRHLVVGVDDDDGERVLSVENDEDGSDDDESDDDTTHDSRRQVIDEDDDEDGI